MYWGCFGGARGLLAYRLEINIGHPDSLPASAIRRAPSRDCFTLLQLFNKARATGSRQADTNVWRILSGVAVPQLARISHQDHGSRRRIRVRKRCSGAKSVAIATV